MAIDYTNEEILAELACLGYKEVSDDQLYIFKRNLLKLIQSERSKNASWRNISDVPEARGNCRNDGNQWLQNNQKNDWQYPDVNNSTCYSCTTNDFGGMPAGANMYNKHPGVRTDTRGYSFLDRSDFNNASSEPHLKSKMVKWKMSRDGTFDNVAGDAIKEDLASVKYSGHYDEIEMNKIMQKHVRSDNDFALTSSSSAHGEQRNGQKGLTRNISGIITRKEHPHTRNLYRSKPFERHQMYLRAWRNQPPIGEACRNSVCWTVHKKLLRKEEIKFPQKTLTPNPYVVPTDKPRYELRWAIRQCNENYELPPCGFFHEV